MKEAMRMPKDPKKKVKNVYQGAVQGKYAKIYIPNQEIGDTTLPYNPRGLKRERKEAKLKHKEEGSASKKKAKHKEEGSSSEKKAKLKHKEAGSSSEKKAKLKHKEERSASEKKEESE
ncbi:hypothetical protein AALP_AA8G418900 [Arabis alpina]|uniref:Uncharacterized protein n=1 Tax=Arabis alpina TaxID=50452 RepID=A0A087GCV6_ARAAL|nr:hypothetical protein AALP_AA8G418900 [Arabis alpina]